MTTLPHVRRNHLAVDPLGFYVREDRSLLRWCARHLYDAVPNWREAHEELIGFIVRDGLRR